MVKEKVYYIGFNPINGICNENFFEGSITLYPTGEKGNIFYSNKIVKDKNNPVFLEKYKSFIRKTVRKIHMKHEGNVGFILFNDKSKITKICSDIDGINFIIGNNQEILNYLNDKFKIRKDIEKMVPILKYEMIVGQKVLPFIKKNFKTSFVIQSRNGAGGTGTNLINIKNIHQVNIIEDDMYAISPYIKNTPINSTLVIGEYQIIEFPPSVQLIEKNGSRFKYIGADFIYPQFNISEKIKTLIHEYNYDISKYLKSLGYRGIVGIDYILVEDKLFFMEINPRFQASSFLINLCLDEKYNSCLAELHYKAITKKIIDDYSDIKINYSFVNSNADYVPNNPFKIIKNGYFPLDKNSVFRIVYDRSIIDSHYHEHKN